VKQFVSLWHNKADEKEKFEQFYHPFEEIRQICTTQTNTNNVVQLVCITRKKVGEELSKWADMWMEVRRKLESRSPETSSK